MNHIFNMTWVMWLIDYLAKRTASYQVYYTVKHSELLLYLNIVNIKEDLLQFFINVLIKNHQIAVFLMLKFN